MREGQDEWQEQEQEPEPEPEPQAPENGSQCSGTRPSPPQPPSAISSPSSTPGQGWTNRRVVGVGGPAGWTPSEGKMMDNTCVALHPFGRMGSLAVAATPMLSPPCTASCPAVHHSEPPQQYRSESGILAALIEKKLY
eukprot:gene9496-biopygen10736